MTTKEQKTKIKDAAKDLNLTANDIVDIVKEKTGAEKKPAASITETEMNLVLEHITQTNQVKSFDAYFAATEKKAPVKEEKPAEKPVKAEKTEKAEKPAEKKAEKKPTEVKQEEKPAEKPVEKATEKAAEKPIRRRPKKGKRASKRSPKSPSIRSPSRKSLLRVRETATDLRIATAASIRTTETAIERTSAITEETKTLPVRNSVLSPSP